MNDFYGLEKLIEDCELPIGTVLALCSNFVGIGVEISIIGKID